MICILISSNHIIYFFHTYNSNNIYKLNVIKTLDGLNIDNLKLNKTIAMIKRDIFQYEERLNNSFSHGIDTNKDWNDVDEQYINSHLHLTKYHK